MQKRRGEAEFLAHRALGWIPGSAAITRRRRRRSPNACNWTPTAPKSPPGSEPCWLWTGSRQIRYPLCGTSRAPPPTAARRPARRSAASTEPRPGTAVYHLPRRNRGPRSIADCLRGGHLSARRLRYRIGIRRRAAQAGRGTQPHQSSTGIAGFASADAWKRRMATPTLPHRCTILRSPCGSREPCSAPRRRASRRNSFSAWAIPQPKKSS